MEWPLRSPKGSTAFRLLRLALPVAIALLAMPTVQLPAASPPSRGPSGVVVFAVDPVALAAASLAAGHGPAAAPGAQCSLAPSASATCTLPSLAPHPSAGPTNENWVQLTGVNGPSRRWITMMAYDPIDNYTVLFGGVPPGQAVSATLGDTWVYAAGVWTNLTANLTAAPSMRYASSLAWDARDGYLVLFGGHLLPANTVYNDTWEFLHGAWTPLTPTSAPAARWRAAMTYDVNDSYLLLFGGTGLTNTSAQITFNDTWAFAGGQWTNLSSTTTGHPLPRYRASMAYDARDKYAVLFGGCTSTASLCETGDTWIYTNHSWTNKSSTLTTHPSARVYFGFTWDSALKADLLFGGSTSTTSGQQGDTWLFLNGTWSSLALATHPAARGYEALADDTGDGYLMLFGGTDYTTYYNDTWSFGPALVTALHVAPTTLDQGQNLTLTSAAWPTLTSYNRSYAGLPAGCASANLTRIACVPTAAGAYTIEGFVNTTTGASYTRNGSITINLPPQITSFTATPSVLTVGVTTNLSLFATAGTSPLSYAYTGLPAGCFSANRTWITCRPSTPGSYTLHGIVRDAVGNQTSMTASLTVFAPPAVTGFTVSRTFVDVGQAVTFRANESGGTPPVHFAYTGLPGGCSSADTNLLACVPQSAGTYIVTVNASDTFGYFVHAAVTVTVAADPSLWGFVATPSSVDLGASVTFNFSVANGTGAYTFAYRGLPRGCTITGGSGQSCQPTVTGTFAVIVSVTDGAGFTVNATTSLVVNALPAVTSFTVTPNVVDTGQSLNFVVAAGGGTAPLTYSFTLLPTGCAGATTATFSCRPTAAGTFSTAVTVSDAFHATAQGTAVVIVHRAPTVTSFAASPAPVVAGTSTTLTTVVAGGTGALTFLYTGLPLGCASVNSSSVVCRPTVTGSYSITVNVTDQLGSSVQATTTLVVTPVPANPSSGSGSLLGSPWVLLGLLLAVVAVAAIAVIAMRRRRPRSPTTAEPAAAPEPEPDWAEGSEGDGA
ncbi:MAG: hypothetical protein L3K15_01400 [Thermoplasmata archaeon]|nr:hypothetical protein [Thermoplasmata archaeon]